MILRDLIKGLNIKRLVGPSDVVICGISHDSSKVEDGFLFAALKGDKTDGHIFVEEAVKRGARALLVERIAESNLENITVIQVDDTRASLGHLSANFYKNPTRELKLIGVTGTNGKTTITYLLESILKEEKKKTGVIGTIEYRYSGKRLSSNMTTPESVDLMQLFRNMVKEGVEFAVMEVSSHALDKRRVVGCHFDAAIFSNLSQDHLDYHGTLANYFEAKKRLFSEILKVSEKDPVFSVINIDDDYGREISRDSQGILISYSSADESATVFAEETRFSNQGIAARVGTPWGRIVIDSKLVGTHNLSNILGASAAALSLGVSSSSVVEGISKVSHIPGRLESVGNPFGFNILVDYAHTPDALKNVLMVVRTLTKRNLILVFGCGGDRDPLKRSIMGKIGRELSDILIVTSDNPRSEHPERIIDQIEEGVFEGSSDGTRYFRISDRRSAIGYAIDIAKEGDSVLIAGKGHENYQILGTGRIHFDDKEEASSKIQGKMGSINNV